MIHKTISASFQFLTPAFVHGVYQGRTENTPELRAPSIRGMLRWWWRTLGYGLGNEIFGSASGKTGTASMIQIRLISPPEPSIGQGVQLLAHKNQGGKNALQPMRDLYTVELRPLRAGITSDQFERLQSSLDAWLLMGAIGQRSGRCCGSIWTETHAPSSAAEYLTSTRHLLNGSKTKIAILDQEFQNEEATRKMAGRFPKHDNHRSPIPGRVFGSANPRKSSSLKLRTVYLDGHYRIAALWCPKGADDTSSNLAAALRKMKEYPVKVELAQLIENSLPDLTT